MNKKLVGMFLCASLFILFVSSIAFAGNIEYEAKVGTNYYETLIQAINQTSSEERLKITLLKDISLTETISIENNQKVILDMNGHNIIKSGEVIHLYHGSLELKGKGKIIAKKSEQENAIAIAVKGSANFEDVNYTTLKVGKDVTLEGNYVLFVRPNSSTQKHAYGVKINIDGNIIADTTGELDYGMLITINGNIQDTQNCPIITIGKTAKFEAISGDYTAIYAAGYAKWIIEGGDFTSPQCIEIKAGEMTINGGTYASTIDEISHKANNGGTSSSGASLSIVENSRYAGNIKVNINDGYFAKNVQVVKDSDASTKPELEITGGMFTNDVSEYVASDKHIKNVCKNINETTYNYLVIDLESFLNPEEYTVIVTCSKGGTTNCNGRNKIYEDDKLEINIECEDGYKINGILLDGKKVDEVSDKYVINDITANHSVYVSFKKIVEETEYEDVESDTWYSDAIKFVTKNKVMQGYGTDKFKPEEKLTRAMLVQILYNLEERPEVSGEISFDDVDASAWYLNAVKWAKEKGLINGRTENKFEPDSEITREEMMTIIYRYAKLKGKGFTGTWVFLLEFADKNQISSFAYEPMCYFTMNNVIKGTGNNMINPLGTATRAEAATIIMRYMELK